MWEHARRWRVGDPAESAGGRLDLHSRRQILYPPGPDFIYTNLSGGRGMDFIYTNRSGGPG